MWEDWKWQLRAAVKNVAQLRRAVPALSEEDLVLIEKNSRSRRFMITPYVLSLVTKDSAGRPLPADPLWRQLVAAWPAELDEKYHPDALGWEHPRDMVSPNIQWKYPNRALVRTTSSCLGLCQFCVLAERTLEMHVDRQKLEDREWQDTLKFVRDNPQIEEVILSGGDPFLLVDHVLESRLADLRRVGRDLLIRINTRALTHNPFRITPALTKILGEYDVNTIGIHVTHPQELTAEFNLGVRRLQQYVPVMVSNIPLLRDVNDDVETMRDLCMGLYKWGVVGGYLFHFAPNSPGAKLFATSVSRGIEIVRGLRRHISGPAVPSFVLLHPEGKLNVPIDDSFSIIREDSDGVHVRFSNWRGEIVDYVT